MVGSHIIDEMGLMMTKLDILQKSNCYGRTHFKEQLQGAESVSKAPRKMEP